MKYFETKNWMKYKAGEDDYRMFYKPTTRIWF